LKLTYDDPLSNFAFKFNLRRYTKLLELAGAAVAAPESATFNGITLPAGPRVVLRPSFACTFEELKGKVSKQVKVGAGSVLIVEGAGVRLESLVGRCRLNL
jgi:UDP-sugar pyrophosphorylase